jgi:4-hydroxybenzoate polyprenyltransferase
MSSKTYRMKAEIIFTNKVGEMTKHDAKLFDKLMVIFKTLRPGNWIKNIIVFAPLTFSGRFTQVSTALRATLAFICFCIVSSAIYIVNDVCDKTEDQQHPTKKRRPIANGAIASSHALIISIFLMSGGLAIARFLGSYAFIYILLYILISIAYSLVIKHVAILDVLKIALGFVLRILVGGAAVSVVPSYWLILCTVMISIFLGFTKRRVELVTNGYGNNNSRPVLKDYSISFLDQVIPMVTGATILAYALYTIDEHTQIVLGTTAMLLTLPFVIYGLLRYIYLIYHLQKGADPTATLISDIPTVINLFLWVVASLIIVKYGYKIDFFH